METQRVSFGLESEGLDQGTGVLHNTDPMSLAN